MGVSIEFRVMFDDLLVTGAILPLIFDDRGWSTFPNLPCHKPLSRLARNAPTKIDSCRLPIELKVVIHSDAE